MEKISMPAVALEMVQSSYVRGLRYQGSDLLVQMGNRFYIYHSVPVSVIAELKAAPSVGRYIARRIKPRYKAHEVQFTAADGSIVQPQDIG